LVTVLLMMQAPVSATPSAPAHRNVLGIGAGAVPGKYMVELKDNAMLHQEGVSARARALAGAHQGALEQTFGDTGRYVAVDMTAQQAQDMANDPDVESVTQQHFYRQDSTEINPPWNLDRIDQRALSGDQAFHSDPFSAGAGVHVYVVDSGIRINHSEINGRASWGFNALDGTTNADDCYGHGSHVAGIIGGNTYGVAKKVQLISVRVSNCFGYGTDPQVVAGINWARTDVLAKKAANNGVWPALIELALEPECFNNMIDQIPVVCPAGTSSDVVNAENLAIINGIPVVASAGNDNFDACLNPIAAAPGVIIVGATDRHDNKLPQSNWGSCVTIWAPGEDVASIGGIHRDPTGIPDTDPAYYSGTSQAVPHVTGALAVLLSTPQFAHAGPYQLAAELDRQATLGALSLQPNQGPNKLVYVQPTFPHSGTSIALAHNNNGTLSLFGTNPDNATGGLTPNGHMFINSQTTAGSTNWTGWSVSDNGAGWASLAAAVNQNGKIETFGLTATDQVWRRQQIALDSPKWTLPSPVGGLLAGVALARNANGRMEAFGVNRQGQLFYLDQTVAGDDSTWGAGWTQFSVPVNVPYPVFATSSVAAGLDPQGLIEVFFVDTHGNVVTTKQVAANTDNWTALTALPDMDHRPMSEIAVARHSDGRLDLVGTDTTGGVFHRAQTSGGTFLSWSALPENALVHVAAEVNTTDDTLEVVGVDPTSGGVWQTRQTAADSPTFVPWSSLGGILRP
jgi:hypothetical protein